MKRAEQNRLTHNGLFWLALAATGCGDDSSVAHGQVDGSAGGDTATTIDAGPKGSEWFLDSARILALREQDSLFLDEARASQIADRLDRARQVSSGTSVDFDDVFARPSELLDVVEVSTADPSIRARWEDGDPSTGQADLDALITSLEPTVIRPYYLDYFELWFAAWVSVNELVQDLSSLPSIDAKPRYPLVDGDDINLSDAGATSRFTFIVRWGDCFSGCQHSHHWEVDVPDSPDEPGELVAEGGDVLP